MAPLQLPPGPRIASRSSTVWGQSFFKPLDPGHPFAVGGGQRRIPGPHQRWPRDAHGMERVSADVAPLRLRAHGHIGKLGHDHLVGTRRKTRIL